MTGIDWLDARALCQFLGKQLPTTEQWSKALRGGDRLVDGSINTTPRRNLPWGTSPESVRWVANERVAEVGSHFEDVSPFGVLDMAGNVTEWTVSRVEEGVRVVRGANWEEVTSMTGLIDFTALDNPRAERHRRYSIGVRCVTTAGEEP